ncbi:MAG: type VI secretion system domain-containing protein [Polyangia bacterium]
MDSKWVIGPSKAREKHPELFDLGKPADANAPADTDKAEHAAKELAKKWRGRPIDRAKVDVAEWLSSLLLLARHKPSIENFIYLCAAAYDWRQEGRSFSGLAAGMWAFADFLDTEAGKAKISHLLRDEDEAAHERGVASSRYELLVKDLNAALEGTSPPIKAGEDDLVGECIVAAERLEEGLLPLSQKQEGSTGGTQAGQAPPFSGITNVLRKIQERAHVRKSDGAEPPLSTEPQQTEPLTTSKQPDWRSWMARVAADLRAQQRQNPLPYLLVRVACWAEQMGRSLRFTEPTPEEFKQLDGLLREGQAAQCLELCEKLFIQHPLSLDVNFFCMRALDILDCAYARNAIGYLTCILIEHLPEIITKRDPNAPEIRQDTKRWLQQEQIRWRTQATESQVNLPAEDLVGALTILQRSMMQSRSRQRHFQLRLTMVSYCLDLGRADLAVPILDLLKEEAETFRLAEWDPELLTELLLIEVRAATMGQADPEGVQRRVRARLCQLDPVLVAKLDASQ